MLHCQLPQPLPLQLAADMELQVEPTAELGVCPAQEKGSVGQEVLIKWKSLPEFEAIWELFDRTGNFNTQVNKLFCSLFPFFSNFKKKSRGVDTPPSITKITHPPIHASPHNPSPNITHPTNELIPPKYKKTTLTLKGHANNKTHNTQEKP